MATNELQVLATAIFWGRRPSARPALHEKKGGGESVKLKPNSPFLGVQAQRSSCKGTQTRPPMQLYDTGLAFA